MFQIGEKLRFPFTFKVYCPILGACMERDEFFYKFHPYEGPLHKILHFAFCIMQNLYLQNIL